MRRVRVWAGAQFICLQMVAFVAVHGAVPAGKAHATPPLSPAQVLDRPPMSLTPTELQRAATSLPVPEGEGLLTVARQIRYAFDAQGRATASFRGVVRILTTTGARSFGPLESEWAPWHQERPQIRARVIGSDGRIYTIDERIITEQPVYPDDDELHSDRRMLKVPLPALQPGSVIEYETVVTQSAPLFAQGEVWRQYFTSHSPTGLIRLLIEAPSALPLRYAVHGLAGAPRRSQTATTTRLVFEQGPLQNTQAEESLPRGMTPLPPWVVFSTGQSWKQVASAYGAVVDARLSTSPLPGLAQRIVGSARSRTEIVQRLLRYLRSEVRYTAVELGDSALLPRSPGETLSRKFGDCKDQATLLVGLLRELGLPAYVALMRTGMGVDVERNLPGLGLFDHAIVYLPATSQRGRAHEPAMWVDPTLEYGQPDALPIDEQGRLALVASPSTAALVMTPVLGAVGNRIRETREVNLAEYGPARIVETTEAWGSAERTLRQTVRQLVDERKLEKKFGHYAEEVYKAQGEVRTQASTPEDLETPFRLRIEAARASRGYTTLSAAAVVIPLDGLLQRLPAELLDSEEDEDQAEPRDPKAGLGAQPYRFEPLVQEWQYRIVPPPGFRPVALPRSEVIALGQGRLSKSFAVAPGPVITVLFRFDSGPGSLTLAEYQATRRAIAAFLGGEALTLRFEQIAEAHLAAGRFREAYAEYRRLADLHPGEALHGAQLAHALLQGGMGESARQLAAAAVAQEPQSAVAHRLRGSVLMHDLTGRYLAPGWDRAAAIAALRRAQSLSPNDRLTQNYLALCLEKNTAGTTYGAGSDLSAALVEWRALVLQDPKPEYQKWLFIALLAAGRDGELDKVVAAMPKGDTHDTALLMSTAVTRGAVAAVETARSRISNRAEQRTALRTAAQLLMTLRHYSLSAILFDEAATDANDPQELREDAALARRLHRHEESATLSRPADLLSQYMARTLLDDAPGAPSVRALFGRQMDPFVASRAFDEERRRLRVSDNDNNLGSGFRADLITTFLQTTVQGNDRVGFWVQAKSITDTDKDFSMFVARQGGRFQIIGQSDQLQSLGNQASYQVDRGELAAAQQLLAWAHALLDAKQGAAPLQFEPFTELWAPDEPLDADRLRVAAAALNCSLRGEPACPEPQRSRALGLLTEARNRFGGEARYELALASLYERSGRYEDALAATARLRQRGPVSPAAEILEVMALHGSRRTEVARAKLDAMLYRSPKVGSYWKLLAELTEDSGDFATAEFCWRKLKELGEPESLVLTNLGWLAVLTGKVTKETEADARRAVQLTKGKDVRTLRILAAILVENGKPTEALDLMRQVSARSEGERAPVDHYLVGRLAEHFGERQAALAAYGRIPLERGQEKAAASIHWLAQRRLAALMKISRAVRRRVLIAWSAQTDLLYPSYSDANKKGGFATGSLGPGG